jgi:hypothetical protein
MAPPPTVLSIKQSFLSTQTRLLSQPLAPSRQWRRAQAHASDDDEDARALPDQAVDDALFKLNHALQQHSRRVYPPQATRHVAEQLDRLYLDAAEREDGRGVKLGEEDLAGVDYGEFAWENGRLISQ